MKIAVLAALCGLALAAPAFAKDKVAKPPKEGETVNPVDIGVIKNSDIRVVQRQLYPKRGRTEFGVHLGAMPFDAYTIAPNAQLSFDLHLREQLAFDVVLGGGYGIETGTYRQLSRPPYSVAYDAYRYLASGLVGVAWSPIYAKMSLGAGKIVHHDVYGAARLGATLESSVIPTGGIAVAPTLSLGIGTRLFASSNGAVRIEIRDDLMIEHRKLTDSTHFKQNWNVTVGYSFLSKYKERRP